MGFELKVSKQKKVLESCLLSLVKVTLVISFKMPKKNRLLSIRVFYILFSIKEFLEN